MPCYLPTCLVYLDWINYPSCVGCLPSEIVARRVLPTTKDVEKKNGDVQSVWGNGRTRLPCASRPVYHEDRVLVVSDCWFCS